MPKPITSPITVIVETYTMEDRDDCLTAAREHVLATLRGLELHELTAQWGNADGEPDTTDDSRETILVTFG